MGVNVYAIPVHIVFCVNNIHIVFPSNQLIKIRNSEAFLSVHHVSFTLCYMILFPLRAVRIKKVDDIKSGAKKSYCKGTIHQAEAIISCNQ